MKRSFLLLPVVGALALSACSAPDPTGAPEGDGDTVAVTAAFYPLAYAAERVGGDRVTVTNLVKPGAEPHDVELTPRTILDVRRSAVTVYVKGFQPAVDEALAQIDQGTVLDVTKDVDLTIEATDDGHDHAGGGAEPEGVDAHFWLDPTRYASAVKAIATKLSEVDGANAAAYATNADAFVAELTALDEDFSAGLSDCANRDLVTGHAAFAYLADRYDLHQEGIAGLSPDTEPNAATMKAIIEHVREHDVSTIYAETLVSRNAAETIARETGASVAVLDPIEGLTDASSGSNYVEVMRSNLATLQKGQVCQ